MSGQAKPRCLEHHRAAVERIINALSEVYLLLLSSGEIFEDLKDCNRRLRSYAFTEGFNIRQPIPRSSSALGISYKARPL
jgi:hypothetical protein